MDEIFPNPILEDLALSSGYNGDAPDSRDLNVRDAVLAGAIPSVDAAEFDRGFNAYEAVQMSPEKRDQRSRLTCVAEGYSQYGRVLRKKAIGKEDILAASSIYPFIAQPNGGASLRDGAKEMVAGRLAPKSVIPDEDANGNPLPESMVRDRARITQKVALSAAETDVFDAYRMAEGSTDNIFIFAAAIKTGLGIVGGFTGTNEGWTIPACRAPKIGEYRWGHCVYLPAFGLTDVDAPGVPKGTRAMFTRNSWGGRYTFQTGRWAGYQAIPEAYLKVSEMTAAGEAKGIYVFNGWTVTPGSIVNDELFGQDFVKKNEKRLIRNRADGSFALVLTGRFMQVKADRAGLAAITMIQLGVTQTVEVDGDVWNRLATTSVFTNF